MQDFFSNLGTADGIVLAVCVVLAIRGAFKGFAWQAVRTVGLIAALWLAGMFHADVGAWMEQKISILPSAWASTAGWLAVLIGVWLIVGMLAWMARGAVRTVDLTGTDRALGFGLGAVMGLAFATVGFVVFGRIASEKSLTETLTNSHSAQYMARLLDIAQELVPPEICERYCETFDAIREAGGQTTEPTRPVEPNAEIPADN